MLVYGVISEHFCDLRRRLRRVARPHVRLAARSFDFGRRGRWSVLSFRCRWGPIRFCFSFLTIRRCRRCTGCRSSRRWPEIIYVTIVIIIAIFITASYANSRTMMARIAPPSKMTEFFGLYALSGTATAFLAPFVVARATEWSQSQHDRARLDFGPAWRSAFAMMLFVKNERAVAVDRSQCRKWRMPVKTMARPRSSAAAMTSSSRIEPPGWMTAVAPASAAAIRPSAKGKKASEATTEPLASDSARPAALRRFLRLARGDARGIDAAHLAGADADGGAVLGIDDGVRLDVLGDAPGEEEVGDLGCGRRALGDDLAGRFARCGRCRGPAPASRRRPSAASMPARAGSGRPPASSRRRFFLAARMATRVGVGVGRDDDLGEDLGDARAVCAVERAVAARRCRRRRETGSQRSACA